MTDTSEVSLNRETQVEASAGRTRITACGRTILKNTCGTLIPSAKPAFHCPWRIDMMPARNVSELNEEMLHTKPTSAVVHSENQTSKNAGRM
jgi:hypothetical protein